MVRGDREGYGVTEIGQKRDRGAEVTRREPRRPEQSQKRCRGQRARGENKADIIGEQGVKLWREQSVQRRRDEKHALKKGSA